jgi:hypothetical protein
VIVSHLRPRALLVLPLLMFPFLQNAKNRLANSKSVLLLYIFVFAKRSIRLRNSW